MSQICHVLCVSKQPIGAEYETVLVPPLFTADIEPEIIDEAPEILFSNGKVSDSQYVTSNQNPPVLVCSGGDSVGEGWNSEGRRNGQSPRKSPGNSATLPNRGSQRHSSHVSFGQQNSTSTGHATSKLSILKSPAKLPAGRIEVIKEEVELEVASNSRLTTTTTTTTTNTAMQHRSVENMQIPVKQSTPGSHGTSFEISHLASKTPVSVHSDRIDFPIYSEPVIAPAAFGNKLRADYYDSQGSHLKSTQLADDDPGVMSEADTTATGFRRGGKARSSLPIVRTPSKTLEKPLGLVFLQFREETKRAVLPNEITTLDTVKALFVRAFPKALTMEYLDCSQQRRIYVLDQRKDMFYELEDLRDIRDRSVLKILEADQLQPANSVSSQLGQLVDEINYFSEPEYDTLADSFRNPGPHSAKIPRQNVLSSANSYNANRSGSMSHSYPSPQYSGPPVPPKPQRSVYGCYTPLYEESIYANAGDHKRPPSRSGTATPIIDEEARYRVDAMERHLANLTGLVQQALTGNHPISGPNSRRPSESRSNSDYANVYIAAKRPVVLQKDKATPSVNGPVKLTNKHGGASTNHSEAAENGIFLRYPDPMLMEYLENVQHKIRDMLGDTRSLRRLHSSNGITMREIVKQNFESLKSQFNLLLPPGPANFERRPDTSPRTRTTNQIQNFQQEATRLSRDVVKLEAAIEDLKAGAVNQKSPVSLRDVERFTTELNDLSNNLSDLRLKFPELQEKLKAVMTSDMEAIFKDEIFIKEEPEKLEEMARRCRKLTGTMLNLNKLASVQDHQPHFIEREVSVDAPADQTLSVPQPPTRRESLTISDVSIITSKDQKRLDQKAQDMLDDLLSELEVFTDVSSRENTPERDNTIKRSPKSNAKSRRSGTETAGTTQDSLSPPSITPSNSSQSTNTTMSSMTDNSSLFSGSDSGTTISRVQVGVGDLKTTLSPVPVSTRSGFSSGISSPARKASDAERNLADWLANVNAPPPPPQRSTSKSPVVSPLSRTGGFFSLPNHGRTVSEPGDFEGGSYSEYMNVREIRSPLKDQRLTPSQQDKIVSYYASKLRKGSDPGTGSLGRSPIDDLASDILANEARNSFYTSRVDPSFFSKMENRDPPALPPKPGAEDPQMPPPLPPRNRQEILEERHQELLRKQKQLQEQYARLQQLQRDQKIRPSSPLNKTSTSPQSGSLNDLKRHQQSKMNGMDIYATPTSKPFFHQMNITNGNKDAKTIYETDIL